MASIVLATTTLAPLSDPAAEVKIPHVRAIPQARRLNGSTVQFAGDDLPTGFRGEGGGRSWQITCRYTADEQIALVALVDLLEAAALSPDSRLLLRTNQGQVAGLDAAQAVQVFAYETTPNAGLFWDVTFTAEAVQYTQAV